MTINIKLTTFSPPSGPATGSFNSLHPKFLAVSKTMNMNSRNNIRSLVCGASLLAVAGMVSSTLATPISYTDWTSSGAGTASGSIGSIGVNYDGDLAFAQTAGGTNYWAAPGNAYTGVPNMPTTSDIIALRHAVTSPNTITFSSPVVNPIMLILSLGTPGQTVYYDFAQDFVILSSGSGYWGGSTSGSLFELAGDGLMGVEGHGAIQFIGTFSSISWTVSPDEYWHGFTIGLPESVPDGGLTFMLLGIGLTGLVTLRRWLAA